MHFGASFFLVNLFKYVARCFKGFAEYLYVFLVITVAIAGKIW